MSGQLFHRILASSPSVPELCVEGFSPRTSVEESEPPDHAENVLRLSRPGDKYVSQGRSSPRRLSTPTVAGTLAEGGGGAKRPGVLPSLFGNFCAS
jgi:hypothetical protein